MKKFFIVFGIMVLLSGCVSSEIKFGSIANINYLTINKDGIGEFKVSFLNMGEEDLRVRLRAEYPQDVRVEISPNELTIREEVMDMPNCSSCEWFVLRDGMTYARAYPVYVYIKIPSEISRNLYRIKLIATAETVEKSRTTGIKQGLAQVREITLTAYVPGSVGGRELGIGLINERLYGEKSLKEEYEDYKTKIQNGENTKSEKSSESAVAGTAAGSGIGDEKKYAEGDGNYKNPDIPQDKNDYSGDIAVSTDSTSKTKIDLPVGQITLSKEQTKTALDIGIITLVISIASLVIRILK